MITNIKPHHRALFEGLRSADNFALFSAFLDTKPCVVIVCIEPSNDGDTLITPVAILLDDTMTDIMDRLTDLDGKGLS